MYLSDWCLCSNCIVAEFSPKTLPLSIPIAAGSGSRSNQGRILCDRKKHHPCRSCGGEVLPQDWPPEQHGHGDHARVSIWITGV